MLDIAWLAFMLEVMTICDKVACHDELLWRANTGPGTEPLKFMMDCSDVFVLHQPDAVEITQENLPILRQAADDVYRIARPLSYHTATVFCARVRGQRPRLDLYMPYNKVLWDIFDACGPAPEESLSLAIDSGAVDGQAG